MLWTNESIQFTFHSHIQEYDMEAASVSVCEHDGLLPQEMINELKLMPKEKRTVKMGKLQRDDKMFSENLLAGIRNMRKKFIETNNLTQDEILSLHSDACILNTNRRIISNIENVNFRKKNDWNAYIRYKGIEMFYKNDIKNNYIDYKNIVPNEFKTFAIVKTSVLSEAIDRASLMAREGKTNILKMQLLENQINISSKAEQGDILEIIDADLKGDPMEIAFNAKYLADVIRNISDEDICLKFNSNVSPCVITKDGGNDYLYLILPVRVFS